MINLGIVKYWQGIAEVILRITVIVLLVILFICTAAVVGSLSHSETPFTPIETLRFNSRSPSGWILLVVLLATPYAIVSLVLRFLDAGCIVKNVKIFLIVDFVENIFLAIALFCGAVPMSFYQSAWNGYRSLGTAEDNRKYNLNGIVSTMGASAAFSFITLFIVIALVVWLILTLVFNWGSSETTYKREFTPKVTMVTSESEEPKVSL